MNIANYTKYLMAIAAIVVVTGCSTTGVTKSGSGVDAMNSDNGGITTGMSDEQNTSTMNGQNGEIPEVRVIYFDFDKDNIRPEFLSVLNAHAAYLRANPDSHVILEGHTDARGTRAYNLALGERRANSVYRYLTVQGVNSSQMEVISYGEERPAALGNSEADYAKNRRVVFDYK